jgi:hypothetical protein
MDLHRHGITLCPTCGTATAHDRACRKCGAPTQELVPNVAVRCPGWGCPLRERCALYLPSNAQGAGQVQWMEPPYVAELEHCPERVPHELSEELDQLTQALRRTVARQNRN